MTDNEITKALGCCLIDECEECPYYELDRCIDRRKNDVLDLINSQKAEIERYLHSIKLLEKDVADAQSELNEFKKMYVTKIAEMAIKKFAERLKEKATSTFFEEHKYIDTEDIDNLLKEMTEQKNEGKEFKKGGRGYGKIY